MSICLKYVLIINNRNSLIQRLLDRGYCTDAGKDGPQSRGRHRNRSRRGRRRDLRSCLERNDLDEDGQGQTDADSSRDNGRSYAESLRPKYRLLSLIIVNITYIHLLSIRTNST